MTGNNGLWKLGKKVTMLALEWKLLEDLQREGIGTQEVEARAWRRQVFREAKKGRGMKALVKGRYNRVVKRDKNFVGNEMKYRIEDMMRTQKKLTLGG